MFCYYNNLILPLAELSLPNHVGDALDMEWSALPQLETFSRNEDNPTVQESPKTLASKHFDRLKLANHNAIIQYNNFNGLPF